MASTCVFKMGLPEEGTTGGGNEGSEDLPDLVGDDTEDADGEKVDEDAVVSNAESEDEL